MNPLLLEVLYIYLYIHLPQLYFSGLFCPHIIRGLMQSNIDKLPSRYFLRRLTRFARNELPFDRHDEKLQGTDGETQRYRHITLMPEFMGAVLEATMSAAGHKRALDVIKELRKQLKKIPVDIGPTQGGSTTQASAANEPIGETTTDSDHGVAPKGKGNYTGHGTALCRM